MGENAYVGHPLCFKAYSLICMTRIVMKIVFGQNCTLFSIFCLDFKFTALSLISEWDTGGGGCVLGKISFFFEKKKFQINNRDTSGNQN